MSSESGQQNKASKADDNKQKMNLTYKDWKSLKDDKKKPTELLGNVNKGRPHVKPTMNKKQYFHANGVVGNKSNYNKNFVGSNYLFTSDNFRCNSGVAGFFSYNNGMNFSNYKNRGNRYESGNDYFSNFNDLNNFGGNTICTKFNNSNVTSKFINSELQKWFRNDNYCYNRSNRDFNYFSQSENFTSDCVYLQNDMMQEPLSNPFRSRGKDYHFLQHQGNSSYAKDGKSNRNNKKINKTKFNSSTSRLNVPVDKEKKSKEPEVYITNPKVLNGKLFIPKPKMPDQNTELTYEEKKQQWKEYRQAIKPFKNRDFYNAKRVVQRLGKKAPNDLNEKELIRLKNAQEYMAEHKSRLNAKYANYVKAEENCNNLGELYILKTIPTNQSNISTKPIIK